MQILKKKIWKYHGILEEKFESFWTDYQSHVFPFSLFARAVLFLDFLRNNVLVNDRGNEPR